MCCAPRRRCATPASRASSRWSPLLGPPCSGAAAHLSSARRGSGSVRFCNSRSRRRPPPIMPRSIFSTAAVSRPAGSSAFSRSCRATSFWRASAAALLRISLSQVYIESGDPALNRRAIAYLNDASRAEGRESQIWRFLAVAYGRDNQIGMAALSLAEEALANGKKKDATQQALRAKQMLTKNSPSYFRADDIHHEAERLEN